MRTLLFLTFISLQSLVFSHEYYFGYAQVEYNNFSQKFEITLTLDSEDLEKSLVNAGVNISDIENLAQDSILVSKTETYCNNHLVFSTKDQTTHLKIIGIKVFLNGSINIYLESNAITLNNTLKIKFDVLMDEFSQQLNEADFIHKGKIQTLPFTADRRTQTIEIN